MRNQKAQECFCDRIGLLTITTAEISATRNHSIDLSAATPKLSRSGTRASKDVLPDFDRIQAA
jgi:hypothetical protein